MPLYRLEKKQNIPTTLEEAWNFVSSPRNLKEVTPDYMGFEITSPNLPEKMYPGMIISYKVSPVLGVKLTWVSEITHVDHLCYFVDEQRIGPYSIWHHEHHLKEIEGGVEMTDIIHYQPPLGPLGAVANRIFIARQLEEVFEYRFTAVKKKFGEYKG